MSEDNVTPIRDAKKRKKTEVSARTPEGYDVSSLDPSAVIEACVADLVDREADLPCDDRVYQAANTLVTVCKAKVAAANETDATKRTITPLDHIQAAVRLSKHMRFWKASRDGAKPVQCTDQLAKQIIGYGKYSAPVITGIVNSPLLARDGTLLQAEGFDENSGLLLAFDGTSFPTWTEALDRNTARKALGALIDLVDEFPGFGVPGERSVWLANIFSVLALEMIDFAPLFAYDAVTKGSGKSLAADAADTILYGEGRAAYVHVMSWNDGDEEENKKEFGAAASVGARVVRLENVKAPKEGVGGATLEGLLTTKGMRIRTLGKSDFSPVIKAAVVATGNRIPFTSDMYRRTIRCQLKPTTARPEERLGPEPGKAWKYPDLVEHIKKQRPMYLSCALACLQACIKEDPKVSYVKRTDHLSKWSDLVARTLVWLGEEDPNKYFLTVIAASESSSMDMDEETAAIFVFMENIRKGLDTAKALAEECGKGTEDALQLKAAVESLMPNKRVFGAVTSVHVGTVMAKTFETPVRLEGKDVKIVKAGNKAKVKYAVVPATQKVGK